MFDEDRRQSGGVVDHLQAPRKKKKDYVVIACSNLLGRELVESIETYVKLNFKGLTTVRPKNAAELQRVFSRQIVLLLIEDSFAGVEDTVKMVRSLKERKSSVPVPTIFFSENPDVLIQEYHKTMAVYQEVDTYLQARAITINQIASKISKSLTEKSVRRSRRYAVDLPVTYFHLTKNREFKGRLVDMSIHGAILKDSDGEIFRGTDQLRINLPLGKHQGNREGDFIKISARVRRVFIDGSQVGISWEYLSENQLFVLTSILTEIVNEEISRKMLRQRTVAALQSQKK